MLIFCIKSLFYIKRYLVRKTIYINLNFIYIKQDEKVEYDCDH